MCERPLRPTGALTLGCDSGHRFDANKRGYITLLRSGSTKLVGDTPAMLDARDAVLDQAGAFGPVAAAVAEAAVGPRIVDAGAGTGYYLRATIARVVGADGLALDLSPDAVARAVRSSDRIDGVVADTWRPLPLRDDVADTVLDIFAPRNLPEFHRILRAGGTLVVVVPRADHLVELRQSTAMLHIPGDKAEDVIASAGRWFGLSGRQHVTCEVTLDEGLAAALVGMGPSARHDSSSTSTVAATTISVDVLQFSSR